MKGIKPVTACKPHKRLVATTKVSPSANIYAAFKMKKTPQAISELGLIEQIPPRLYPQK